MTVVVDAPNAREVFERWLTRGDAVGVFENVDLSSANCGHKVFMPLDAATQAEAKIGQSQAPDGPHGMGWRYRLVRVARHLDEFAFVEAKPEDIHDIGCAGCGGPLFNRRDGEGATVCLPCREADDEDEANEEGHDDEH